MTPGRDAPIGGSLAGRSVLVTGHTGFKGAWLSLWLDRLGARVHGVALDPPTEPNLYTDAELAPSLALDARVDIRDADGIAAALDAADPEVVFHLAAQPLVTEGLRDPAGTFAVNVMGTVTLLDALRRRGRPCVVVVVTSDKCYEASPAGSPHPETDRLGGTEPYGTSKAAAELVCGAYRATYFPPDQVVEHGVRLATVRAGNVIGGGDWAVDRLLPDIVRARDADRPIPIRFPDAVRPWQHVLEPLSGYLRLAERLLADPPHAVGSLCGPWNFGPGASGEVPVRDLVEVALGCWGAGSWEVVGRDEVRHEAPVLRLDAAKAAELLGWHPRWGVAEAVRRTIVWHRARVEGGPGVVRRLCLDDIAAYEPLPVA